MSYPIPLNINTSSSVVKISLPVAIICITLLSACNLFDENDYKIDKVTLSPTFVLPLVHGSLTLEEALSSSEENSTKVKLISDDEGLLHYQYKDSVASQRASELFTIPNQNNVFTSNVVGGNLPSTNQKIRRPPVVRQYNFNISDIVLSEIKFNQNAKIEILYRWDRSPDTFEALYEVDLEIPRCQKNGVPLSKRITPNVVTELSLFDYVLQTNAGNSVNMNIIITEKIRTAAVNAPNATVNVTVQIRHINFKYVKGNIREKVLSSEQFEYDFDDLKSFIQEGDISYYNPIMKISYINAMGVLIQDRVINQYVTKEGAPNVNLTLSQPSPVSIQPAEQIGATKTTEVQVTNAQAVLSGRLKTLIYESQATINPRSANQGEHFVTDTSRLRIRLYVDLPLHASAQNIIIYDTIKTDIGSKYKGVDIDSADLLTTATSQLPLSAKIQIYLADKDYNTLDNLLGDEDPLLVQGATVDASGDLRKEGVLDDETGISAEKIDKIYGAVYIIIKVTIGTTTQNGNTPYAKMKNNQKININLALRARAKIST